jgi:hypothetical protein
MRGRDAVEPWVVPRGTRGGGIGNAYEDPPARPPIRNSWRGSRGTAGGVRPFAGQAGQQTHCVFHVELPEATCDQALQLRDQPGCSTWNRRPPAPAPGTVVPQDLGGCSTWNSHGAQKRGRLAGTPGLRAYRSGHGSSWSSAWYRNSSVHDRPTAMPRRARPPVAQRPDASAGAPASPSSGGSLTASLPPTRRNGAPHSAVTAGGPKPRATTRSNAPRR